MTLEDIAKAVNPDKTTVFRCTQKLYQFGICSKETRSLREDGQYHVYCVIPIQVFKQETENRAREIEQSFRTIIKGFEKDLENMVSSFYHFIIAHHNHLEFYLVLFLSKLYKKNDKAI